MSTYAGSIDKTETGQGNQSSCKVGSGGVTAGDSVYLSADKTVVICTSKSDECYGVALDTVSEDGYVTVLRTGCLVEVPVTLTVGVYVQPEDSGTGGWEDFTDGTKVAIVETGASGASQIRLL